MEPNNPACFAIVHGGGGSAWEWHLVSAELRRQGHRVVAIDLPVEDPACGVDEYADAIVAAVGDQPNVAVVGHSLGGLTAPVAAERLNAGLIILVTAMIPKPGEPCWDWWSNTGHDKVAISMDTEAEVTAAFMHDVPPELAAEAMRRGRDQQIDELTKVWPLDAWPQIPTRFLLCGNDRFFPPEFMRPVVAQRLGIVPDEIGSSHTPYLSHPVALSQRLIDYWTELSETAA